MYCVTRQRERTRRELGSGEGLAEVDKEEPIGNESHQNALYLGRRLSKDTLHLK